MANLRVRDVAERLDVSSKTVYKWLREGLIPASRLGKSWIISEGCASRGACSGFEPTACQCGRQRRHFRSGVKFCWESGTRIDISRAGADRFGETC